MVWRRARPGSQEEHVGRLIIAGVLVMVLPGVPILNIAIYPFYILTTWFHEMGHGLTALLLGNQFEQLTIFPDGSGVASSRAETDMSGTRRALIAAGGPLGPSVAGSLLILASAREKFWRPTLYALAAAIVLSVVVWVDGMTGWIVLPLVAALLCWIAWKARDWLVLFALQFLGVLAALSMFNDWDYLFSEAAMVGGRPMYSDTGAMEQALWLPYWLWAAIIILVSGLMIGASLKYALNREG